MTKRILRLHTTLILFNYKHTRTALKHVHFRRNGINWSRSRFRNDVSRGRTEILCWRHGTKLLFVLHVLRGVRVYKRYEGTPTHHNHAPPLWTTDRSPFHRSLYNYNTVTLAPPHILSYSFILLPVRLSPSIPDKPFFVPLRQCKPVFVDRNRIGLHHLLFVYFRGLFTSIGESN